MYLYQINAPFASQRDSQKHSKILLTPNFKLNLRSNVQSCMWLGPIWMQNGKCTAGCGILMCHDCETSVLVSVVKPLASLCCPGSLLRKDHWVRVNSPSVSCAKVCRASPSCSAPQSLQSWWLAPSSSLTLLLNHEAVSHWSKRVSVRLKTDWMIVAVYSHAGSWLLKTGEMSKGDFLSSFIFKWVLERVLPSLLITWDLYHDGRWTKFRVTGLVLIWQNQTTPIQLCWYHDADHHLALSTQALILSLWSTCTWMCDITSEQPIMSLG